jgi:hypothetical protein
MVDDGAGWPAQEVRQRLVAGHDIPRGIQQENQIADGVAGGLPLVGRDMRSPVGPLALAVRRLRPRELWWPLRAVDLVLSVEFSADPRDAVSCLQLLPGSAETIELSLAWNGW